MKSKTRDANNFFLDADGSDCLLTVCLLIVLNTGINATSADFLSLIFTLLDVVL